MDSVALFDRAKELTVGGQLDAAWALTDRLLSQLPGQSGILLLRAVILERRHRCHDALAITSAILAECPNDLEATALHGQLLIQTGQLEAAAATLERAGLLMVQAGQIDRAEAQWQAALVATGPVTADRWIDLLWRIHAQANDLCLEPFWQKAIWMPTDDPSVKLFQASGAYARGEYGLFLSLYEGALAVGVRDPQADCCYAMLLVAAEKYREALPVCDRLRGGVHEEAIAPFHALALIQCGVAHQQDINRLLIRWGRTALADRPAPLPLPSARRPLRLGFCSFWLGASPFLARVIHPLAVAMARQGVEITLYALGDGGSQSLPALPGCRWVALNALDDAAAAAVVRNDRLHALITLDLTPCWPRAGFYRYRPAPWICSYMHPHASHGGAVDALLLDSWTQPPCPQDDFVEEIVITPECWHLYPIDPAAPDITPPPALTAGHITFGSFNRPCKIGPETAAAWARLLRALPTARLYLRSRYFDDHETSRIGALFQQAGIAPDRVAIEGNADLATFMRSYSRIDIALDTFFNNGGITTAEALWQGVPLIAIPGATITSRMSASILDGIGMQEWIARDEEDWLAKTVALACDLPALRDWRQNLRPRMATSIICDADRAAANLLAAIAPAIDRRYDQGKPA